VLEYFLLKKLHNINVVTLNVHRTMRIFHCWKQSCRSSDSLFMSSVAFAFTASTDSNPVPFNADLIFGGNKSHMGLGQVSTVDVPTRWSCASSKKSWQTGRCVPARCLGEESMRRSSTFQVFSSHPFMKVCQNLLVVDLVNGLTFRHPSHVNNPSDVEKNDHHCFKYGFALPCFLSPWWTGALPVHGLTLTFWVVLKKTWLITSYYVL